MSNQERMTYRRHQIQQWQASGLNGARYCKDNDVHLNQFYYGSKQLEDKPITKMQGLMPALHVIH
jgi:hypothetical protein